MSSSPKHGEYYGKPNIDGVIKRDGSQVAFDRNKIEQAINKAAERDIDFKLLTDKVIKHLEQVPRVEEIQDAVENILVEAGHYRTAKSYILYRQEHKQERDERSSILDGNTDEISRDFSKKALRVLASRYLKKDNEGQIIESPSELFERVATHITIPDILYDKRIFDKQGGHSDGWSKEKTAEDAKHWYHSMQDLYIGDHRINKYTFESTAKLFKELAGKGQMKVQWNEFLSMFRQGEFDEYLENWQDYYDLMVNQAFEPNSPTLFNAGNKLGQLSACFSAFIEDDMENIMETAKEAALIFKSGGGVGINMSPLRPSGDYVSSTSGVSSGPVSFMDIFDTVTDVVSQAGKRRGAMMGLLNADHPDIKEFIQAKRTNDKLENFNISVGTTKDFWNALESDEAFALTNPRNGETVMEVDPESLLDIIAHSAWESADPGMVFFGRANEYNPMIPAKGELSSTNPCFTGDMKLKTDRGYKRFDELVDYNEVNIVNEQGDITKGKVWSSGQKEIISVHFWNDALDSIKCTKDHIFKTSDGKVSMAGNLKGKRVKLPLNKPSFVDKRFVKLGFAQGDGNLSRMKSDKHDGFVVNIGKDDDDVKELFTGGDFHKDEKSYYTTELSNHVNSLGFDKKVLPERELPNTFRDWNISQQKKFLRGLYSANGSIIGGAGQGRITLKSTCKQLVLGVKEALESILNISPYITTNEARKVEFSNGKYECKESYDLNIGNVLDKQKFYNNIGFIQKYKMEKLKIYIRETSPKVSKITDEGNEEAFDFSEPETHWGVVEGVVASNCSEQILYPYGSCNLGSINLESMIYDGRFYWDEFREKIETATQFLDNVISMNKFPLDKIEKEAKDTRRIGLGVMGLANTLYRMDVQYDSGTAYDFMSSLAEFLSFYSMRKSVDLARKRGSFPVFHETDYTEGEIPISGYYEKDGDRDWDALISAIKKHGIRNSKTTTLPPTGSTAMIADTSHGIEPEFSLAYEKNVEAGDFYYANDVFEKVLREEGLYSEELLEEVASNYGTLQGIDEVPEKIKGVFRTALDIHYLDHLMAQAVWQDWIAASISKTINMPADAEPSDVRGAFKVGHYLGVKGLTVYRDKSKDKQVINMKGERGENILEPSEYAQRKIAEEIYDD